jgi:hypothetical protein
MGALVSLTLGLLCFEVSQAGVTGKSLALTGELASATAAVTP